MTTPRERMTWKSASGPTLPVEDAKKRASAHPATPDEGITHPAGAKDPEANKYENGDTSSWAEDPKGPPYRTSPAPAVPVDDGGYKHPATQPGAPQKNASHDIRAAVERKASLCIKIATHLLGKEASVDMVEAQALDFMDMPDARIASTLRRVEAATEDPEVLLRRMTAEEEGKEEEDEEKDEPKKEASSGHMAEVMSALAGIRAELESLKKGGAPAPEAPTQSADEMLAEMLKQEAPKAAAPAYAGADKEAEEMLARMLAEEEAKKVEPPKPEAPAAAAAKTLADYQDDVLMDPMLDDPMGLAPMAEGEDAILSSLFAARSAADEEEEEEEDKGAAKKSAKAKKSEEDEEVEVEEESDEPEEKDEEEEGKEAQKKKASQDAKVVTQLRPQAKKASTGAKTVGTQNRTASNVGDVSELASLWDSAPDVSKVFGR